MPDEISSDDAPSSLPARPKRRGRGKRRYKVVTVVTGAVVALALVVGLGTAYFYRHLNDNIDYQSYDDQLTNRPTKKDVGPQEPINLLVMGSDTRDGAGNNIDGLTGDGERSDTTLLFHLSADRTFAYGVSIPRDTVIDRPDCKDEDGETIPGADGAMWNEAYSVGGPACTMQQFEQLTGVRIDNYVKLDFNGFRDMVDAIDGVEVCIPEADRGPRSRHQHPGRHPRDRGQGGAQLCARPLHPRRRLRHRPDQAAAGVHRGDGRQGALGRHPDPSRPHPRLPRRRHQLAADRLQVGHPDGQGRRLVQEHRAREDQVRHRAVAVLDPRTPTASSGSPRPTTCGRRSSTTSR